MIELGKRRNNVLDDKYKNVLVGLNAKLSSHQPNKQINVIIN